MAQGSRSHEAMVLGAVASLRERGYAGMSFSDVLATSGAPRGSIYHHFPDGKAQLAREAVELVAATVDAVIDRAQGDPLAALELFVAAWRAGLEASDFRAGCPVVGVVTAADGGPELLAATAAAFASWRRRFATLLQGTGLPPAVAGRRATLVLAAVEGAVVLCRAQRSLAPLEDTAAELRLLLAAVPGARS